MRGEECVIVSLGSGSPVKDDEGDLLPAGLLLAFLHGLMVCFSMRQSSSVVQYSTSVQKISSCLLKVLKWDMM